MVKIQTPNDFLKIPGIKNETIEIIGSVAIPDGVYLRGLENVKFTGGTITGFPPYLENCLSVSFSQCGIRLKRPTQINMPGWSHLNPLPHGRYEQWWAPRIYSTVENGSENISFDSCSFSGMTDEIAAHPDLDKWQIGKWAGSGLRFFNCLFGPSLVNYSRGPHNFNVSVGQWKNVLFEKCVFYGANRRSPQIQGECSLIGCAIYGYGSMAIGIHASSVVTLQDIYGRYSRIWPVGQPQGTSKLVSMVGGTLTSAYGKLGGISIDFSNVVDYTRGWTGRQSIDTMDRVTQKVVPSQIKEVKRPVKYTEAQILSGVGCGDSFDRWILGRIAKRDYNWIKDV